ncbi:MAG TPA: hypothetical protein VKF15_06470 [Nitrososphaerales archaeon]|nr:hypothetical protein [Nitrososphaerales archaeon]
MVDPVLLTTVAVLHIVSAITWLGSTLFLAIVVAPSLRTLSPLAGMEFVARVGRKMTRYVSAAGGLTILFGLALLYVYFGSDYASWPFTLEIGFTIGFIAFLDGALVVGPTINKASDIAKDFVKDQQPGPPPAQFLALMKKGGVGTTISTVLLLVAAVFMVATAFY